MRARPPFFPAPSPVLSPFPHFYLRGEEPKPGLPRAEALNTPRPLSLTWECEVREMVRSRAVPVARAAAVPAVPVDGGCEILAAAARAAGLVPKSSRCEVRFSSSGLATTYVAAAGDATVMLEARGWPERSYAASAYVAGAHVASVASTDPVKAIAALRDAAAKRLAALAPAALYIRDALSKALEDYVAGSDLARLGDAEAVRSAAELAAASAKSVLESIARGAADLRALLGVEVG